MINHHLMGLHHVRDLPVRVPAYDQAFLAIGGVLFIVVGAVLASPSRRRAAA